MMIDTIAIMSTAKITLLIPTYKSERYLPDLLNSLLGQTCQEFDVVVFDHSPDYATMAIIDRYKPVFRKKEISFTAYYSSKETGVGGAVGFLLKHISAPYFLQIDSDDVLEPGAVAEYVYVIEKESPDIIFATLYAYDESLKTLVWTHKLDRPHKQLLMDFLYIKDVHFVPQCIRKESFLRSNKDLDIYQSADGQNFQLILPILLLKPSVLISYITTPVHKYRLRNDSYSRSKKTLTEIATSRKEIHRIVKHTLHKIGCRNPRFYIANGIRLHNELTDLYFEHGKYALAVLHSLPADISHKTIFARRLIQKLKKRRS